MEVKYMKQTNHIKMPECCTAEFLKPKFLLLTLAMLLVGAIVIVAIVRDRIVNPPQYQVSITGQGKVSYKPDIGNVVLGVQVDKADTAQEALTDLSGSVTKILAAIKAAGIPEADVQTMNYSLLPQYDYKNEVAKLAGYSANQQVVVKVRQMGVNNENISKLLAATTKAGANQVLGITFDVSNLEKLKQQARIKAILDARSKAGILGKAAGVRLGRVVGWWENLIQAPGVMSYSGIEGKGGAAGMSPSPIVPSGTQEVIIELSLNYQVRY